MGWPSPRVHLDVLNSDPSCHEGGPWTAVTSVDAGGWLGAIRRDRIDNGRSRREK